MKRLIVLGILMVTLACLPLLAQEAPDPYTLTAGGFSFEVDPALSANINIAQYPGDPPTNGPGFSDAPHMAFTLYDELGLPDSTFRTEALIRLYRVEELQPYRFLAMEADTLGGLLRERPDLELFNAVSDEGRMMDPLPYLPTLPHGQILRARAHYLETDEVDGVAYITYSNATPEPFLSHHFTYTFQGLSKDGQYYISASLPFTTSLFPAEPEPIDPDEFYGEWPEYLRQSIDALNAADASAFSPSLEMLDNLVQSFSFAGE